MIGYLLIQRSVFLTQFNNLCFFNPNLINLFCYFVILREIVLATHCNHSLYAIKIELDTKFDTSPDSSQILYICAFCKLKCYTSNIYIKCFTVNIWYFTFNIWCFTFNIYCSQVTLSASNRHSVINKQH